MNRILSFVIVLFVSFTAACVMSPKEEYDANLKAAQAADLKKTEATAQKQAVVEGFKKDLAELNAEQDRTSLLLAAQGDELCDAYSRLQRFENLERAYNEAKMADNLIHNILASVKNAGKKVALESYTRMKEGKQFGCRPWDEGRRESDMIAEFSAVIDKYGFPEKSDPPSAAIVRQAFLKALKLEIKKGLEEWEDADGENTFGEGGVHGFIAHAMEKWHFTLEELGVPAATWEKLK